MSLKTHGLILTQNNEKMSKSEKSEVIDPEDLIYGTQKLDGQRKFGYGTDVLRLWAAMHDDDKNKMVDLDKIEQANQSVKMFRQLSR